MIKKNYFKYLFAMLVLAQLSFQAKAAIVTIGTDTSDSYAPINRSWNHSACEMLFLSSELGSGGVIDSFKLQKASGATSTTINNIKIYMGEVTRSTVPTTAGYTLDTTGFRLVYSGSFPNSHASGWAGVKLSSPFVYSGSKNLVVFITNSEPAATPVTAVPKFNLSTTSGSYRSSLYNDGTNAWASTSSLTASTDRPNVQFSILPLCSGKPTPGTITGPSAAICKDSAVTLSLSGATTSIGVLYQWKSRPVGSTAGFTGAAADTLSTLTIPAASAALEYRVYVTCRISSMMDSTAIFTLKVVGKPAINPATDTTFCADKSITLRTAKISGYLYQWYDSSKVITGATDTLYTPARTGKFFLKVSTTACSGVTSDTVDVTILPLPSKPAITFTGGKLKTASGYSAYQWYNKIGTIASARDSVFTPVANGKYVVKITNAAGCSAVSDSFLVSTLGIAELGSQDRQVIIYPNPAKNIVTISATVKVAITVTNILGETVDRIAGAESYDMSSLADGMYIFHVADEEGRKLDAVKVIKQTNR